MNKVLAIDIFKIIFLSAIVFFLVLIGGSVTLAFAIKYMTVEQIVEIGAIVITISAYVISSLIFATGLWYATKRSKKH